jgi:SAM-dependent methyltransferase
VTAIDASPEMLEINRATVADSRVRYEQQDLFTWQPEREYDLVFVGFWLSHVPPDLLEPFLDRICRAVRPGGHLVLIDQCDDLRDGPVPDREGIYERRRVADGRAFTIVKVYYHPGMLARWVTRAGFDARAHRFGDSFYYVVGKRVGAP